MQIKDNRGTSESNITPELEKLCEVLENEID